MLQLKNKKAVVNYILIALIFIILLFSIGWLDLGSILGSSNQLTNHTNLECNPRLQPCSWEAWLKGDPRAESVTFQTGFAVKSGVRGGGNCIWSVKYEVYNQKAKSYTDLWEIKNWDIPSGGDWITEVEPVKKQGELTLVFGKELKEGECATKIYPTGNRLTRCVRKEFTLDKDYISESGDVKFRLSVPKIGEGCSGGKEDTVKDIGVFNKNFVISEKTPDDLPPKQEEPITEPVKEKPETDLFSWISDLLNKILDWFRT